MTTGLFSAFGQMLLTLTKSALVNNPLDNPVCKSSMVASIRLGNLAWLLADDRGRGGERTCCSR